MTLAELPNHRGPITITFQEPEDYEVRAIAAILEILRGCEDAEQRRVVGYIASRFPPRDSEPSSPDGEG